MAVKTVISTSGRWLTVAGVAALTLGFAACGDDSSDPEMSGLGDDAVIEFTYGDSSVAPEFHRSYTLTVDRDEVHAVVDSYGDVIGETTVALPAGVWDQLGDNVGEVALVQPDGRDTDGCAGGTSRSLRVADDGEEIVDLYLYLCRDQDGNRTNVDQAEQIQAYIDPVIGVVPDWEELFD